MSRFVSNATHKEPDASGTASTTEPLKTGFAKVPLSPV